MTRERRDISIDDLPAELRPRPSLLRYYVIASFLAGPLFFIPLTVKYVRFRTLRYRIDDEGISMRWGALSQREIVLNYARIQDIHLTSNVLERWLGLAKIRIQTASGSAKAEMVLEGLDRPEVMRDFLYSRMRGGGGAEGGPPSSDGELRRSNRVRAPAPGPRHGDERPTATDSEAETTAGNARDQALVSALNEVTAEIRGLRAELSRTQPDAGSSGEGGDTGRERAKEDR